MNKTLKTIAWICLVLGLLGVAADAAALVFGRTLLERRGAQLEETRETIREVAGDWREHPCLSEGEEGKIVMDRECLEERGFSKRRIVRGVMPGGHSALGIRKPSAGFWILPLLLFAAGPVFVVIGSVMLVVNREPEAEKKKQEKAKPETK